MPRPRRCRCIESYPDYWSFAPQEAELRYTEPEGILSGDTALRETVIMGLDEYETIRLIDRYGLNQEQCAGKMGVARTTVTAIYNNARRKIAEALVDGKILRIEGGNYRLAEQSISSLRLKGENTMRIAVTYENGNVFQHFGRTEQFKVYDIEEGKIKETQIIDTNGSGHGALAGFLKNARADSLICGGIGHGARYALAEAGITLYAGVSGPADQAVENYLGGKLQFSEDATCDHHGHGHGEGHHCGHRHGHGHGEGHHCGHEKKHDPGKKEGHCCHHE